MNLFKSSNLQLAMNSAESLKVANSQPVVNSAVKCDF